jgi:osmotically-inducible protein OsmY
VTWVVRAPDRPLHGEEKKTYTRVRRVLWDYEPLRASHAEIFIDVDGRHVRLTGRVRTIPQRLIAEMLVKRLSGVDDVVSDLVSDAEVVRAVADALARDTRTAPYVIQVDSRHGIVSLRGEVPHQQVAETAAAVAARVPLVATVRSAHTIGGQTFEPVALEVVA